MLATNNFPLIYLISDGTITNENFAVRSARFLELVSAAVRARVSIIQIREKQLSARQVFELTEQAVLLTRNSETRLLVNDRADIALAAGANGVHLTGNSLPVAAIRRNFPDNFVIGASCHSLADIETAKNQQADFAVFSPIFATPSKTQYNLPPQGLEKLREVCAAVTDFPILALGGIDETNFRGVLQTGANGVAAIRFLHDVATLPRIVRQIRNA